MEWIKLNENNLSEKIVLAANFKKGTYGYKEKKIGHLYYDEGGDFFGCVDNSEQLENCTHYIDIDKYDIE